MRAKGRGLVARSQSAVRPARQNDSGCNGRESGPFSQPLFARFASLPSAAQAPGGTDRW